MLRSGFLVLCLVLAFSVTNISLMGASLVPALGTDPSLLIVNNDGSIYLFNPGSRTVIWHSSLHINLVSFNQTQKGPLTDVEYFLPNFDGNFVYVSQRNQPLAIERKQLDKLLNRCFDKANKYFLYDSVDYFMLNFVTGEIEDLKKHFDDKKELTKDNLVVRVDRKYLKSLSHSMHERWSVISSHVSILTTKAFLKNSKAENHVFDNQFYRFYRNSANSIEIEDVRTKDHYELQSESSFISVFSVEGEKITKNNIQATKKYKTNTLELEGETSPNDSTPFDKQLIEYENIFSSNRKNNQDFDVGTMEFCINTVKILDNDSIKTPNHPQLAFSFAMSTVDTSASLTTQFAIGGSVIFVVGICLGFLINKVRKDIHSEMISSKSDMEMRINKIEREMEETKQAPKSMPYVIKYQNLKRSHSDMKVYVSTILSKEAQVNIYPISKHQSIAKRVQIVAPLHNKRLLKVWHHEVNQEEYLVFTDKIQQTLEEYIVSHPQVDARMIMLEIVEMAKTLHSHGIQVHSISPSHIAIDEDGVLKYNTLVPDRQEWSSIEFLQGEEVSERSLLFMLGNILYYVCSKGQPLFEFHDDTSQSILSSFKSLKHTDTANTTFLAEHSLKDLVSNLLSPICGQMVSDFRNINNHLFFWQDWRNLGFVNEFSNYLETHLDEEKVKKFDMAAKASNAIPIPWSRQLPKDVINDIVSFRRYDFMSLRDLVRVIRNKTNHFHELPDVVKRITGGTKEELCKYFLAKFPRLLYFMYRYALKKKWKLHGFF